MNLAKHVVTNYGNLNSYGEGAGTFIHIGDSTKHKARFVTPSVQLFLVEDV